MLIDVGAFENYGKPSCPFIMPCSHSDGQLLALNPPCLHKSMLNLESCPSVAKKKHCHGFGPALRNHMNVSEDIEGCVLSILQF